MTKVSKIKLIRSDMEAFKSHLEIIKMRAALWKEQQKLAEYSRRIEKLGDVFRSFDGSWWKRERIEREWHLFGPFSSKEEAKR